MNNLLDDQDAVDALEALQNEEDNEDAFNEGITLGKLAFVVPILERVYTDSKVDERLRREATNFLKATFALDFLTVSSLRIRQMSFGFRSRNGSGFRSNGSTNCCWK